MKKTRQGNHVIIALLILASIYFFYVILFKNAFSRFGYSPSGTYNPTVDYDFSSFTENKKLSEDFTRVVQDVLQKTAGDKWFQMRKVAYSQIGPLKIREMRVSRLKGFKSSGYVGYDFYYEDGRTSHIWNTHRDHYLFPMAVVFNPNGGLTVKTNGDEMKLDYNTQKEAIANHFEWLLYAGVQREYEKAPTYPGDQAQRTEEAQAEEQNRLQKNKDSWK